MHDRFVCCSGLQDVLAEGLYAGSNRYETPPLIITYRNQIRMIHVSPRRSHITSHHGQAKAIFNNKELEDRPGEAQSCFNLAIKSCDLGSSFKAHVARSTHTHTVRRRSNPLFKSHRDRGSS
jgi:hypothetical protein